MAAPAAGPLVRLALSIGVGSRGAVYADNSCKALEVGFFAEMIAAAIEAHAWCQRLILSLDAPQLRAQSRGKDHPLPLAPHRGLVGRDGTPHGALAASACRGPSNGLSSSSDAFTSLGGVAT